MFTFKIIELQLSSILRKQNLGWQMLVVKRTEPRGSKEENKDTRYVAAACNSSYLEEWDRKIASFLLAWTP